MKIQISADPFWILMLKGLVFMEMRISVMEIYIGYHFLNSSHLTIVNIYLC